MIVRMRQALVGMLPVALLGACSGASPRPELARADDLPIVQISGETAAALAKHVERAVDAVARRDYGEARTEAEAALQLDPRSARARAVAGTVLLWRSERADPPDLFDLHAGERELELAAQLAPDDAVVGWLRARFLAESGHLSAGALAAEQALDRARAAPDSERALLLGAAGNYSYDLGEERRALPHLQAYGALRPDDAAAAFRIGDCLLRIASIPPFGGRPDELEQAQHNAEAAAAAFERSAGLVPADEDAALAAGAALLHAAEIAAKRRDGEARERLCRAAERSFRTAAKRLPASAEALFRAGVAAETRGDDEAAAAAYEQALGRDSGHLGSLLNLAAIADRGEEPDEALVRDLIERALRAGEHGNGLSSSERRRLQARLSATRP
jgi:Tfp pilus assembly protein PilF